MRAVSRRGFSLLEPMIALAILGLAGAGWVTLLAQTRATSAAVDRVERETRAAATLLAGLAREPRRALVARSGRRRVGQFEVRVSQREHDLIAIDIVRPASGAVVLATVVYRPSGDDDGR